MYIIVRVQLIYIVVSISAGEQINPVSYIYIYIYTHTHTHINIYVFIYSHMCIIYICKTATKILDLYISTSEGKDLAWRWGHLREC